MRQIILVLLLAVVGSLTARAGFLYTFEQTGTSNILSFTVPEILIGVQDPLTQAIGQTVGGFTITGAAFGPVGSEVYCLVLASSAFVQLNPNGCNAGGPGMWGVFPNPTTVGVYNVSAFSSVDGFPILNRLTISEAADVPEPGTVAFVVLGFAILAVRRKARRSYLPLKSD